MFSNKHYMRELTLAEVAQQYGPNHIAAKQYIKITHAIRMLDDCRWWQVARKHNIKRILVDTIKQIDSIK